MSTITVYNTKGEKVSEYELRPEVFDVAVNEGLVHQAATTQLANQRQVLAHTKDRSEVRGGGKKPWRQKGTGRARAGSSRSPLWKGGGVTFGPRSDRNFTKDMPVKMRRKALAMVLSDKVRHSHLAVLESLELSEAKTKQGNQLITTVESKMTAKTDEKTSAKRSVLLLLDKQDDTAVRALRNLVGVTVQRMDNINIVDLLKCRTVVLTLAGVKHLERRYGSDA